MSLLLNVTHKALPSTVSPSVKSGGPLPCAMSNVPDVTRAKCRIERARLNDFLHLHLQH